MYIHCRQVQNIPSNIYKQLYRYNFRNDGEMQRTLTQCKAGSSIYESHVLWIEVDGKAVSWSLLYKKTERSPYIAMFYTTSKFRRKGFAAKLASQIKRKFGIVNVFPHDTKSHKFFSKFDFAKKRYY